METTFQYLRQFGPLLAERILETYPPIQSTKDPVAPRIATLLRKALPAQTLAITGTAKYLRRAKAAGIVAECGAGKTYMALGTIHVLADERPSTTLVMCPSHITHKWAREVLLTLLRARAFLIEDMRNGGDPSRPHGICEVKLSKGKTVYEGKRLSVAEMRRMGRKEWRKRFPWPTFFITGKDKGKLGYFWESEIRNPEILLHQWIRLLSRLFRACCSDAVSNSNRTPSGSFDRISVWGYKPLNDAAGRAAQVSPPPQEARDGNPRTNDPRLQWRRFEITHPGQC